MLAPSGNPQAADEPLVVVARPVTPPVDVVAAAASITDGLTTLKLPGSSGGLVVHGDHAVPLLAVEGFRSPLATIATANDGKSRIAVLSADQWIYEKEQLEHPNSKSFVDRIFAFAAGASKDVILVGRQEAKGALEAQGYTVTTADTLPDILSPIGYYGLIIYASHTLSLADAGRLHEFAGLGGGIVVAMKGWVVQSYGFNSGPIEEAPLNRLVSSFGIAMTTEICYEPADAEEPLDPALAKSRHLDQIIARLYAAATGVGAAADADILALYGLLRDATTGRDYPRAEQRVRVSALYESMKADLIPSAAAPIAADDAKRRAAIALVNFVKNTGPAAQVGVNADASTFPGAVGVTVERVAIDADVDTAVERWHSLGLYAAPGDVITVSIPSEETKRNLRVRIGAHQDPLWINSTAANAWARWPQISYSRWLATPDTQIANAHGGVVYIDVPSGQTGIVSEHVSGAVRMPRFVLGQTLPAAWRDTERLRQVPWAEIESGTLVMTLPTNAVESNDDPTAAADWRARRSCGAPCVRYRVDEGRRLSLGLLHELGHNRQETDWTFNGTGEVTVNLFSLYTGSALTGIDPLEFPWVKLNAIPAGTAYLAAPDFAAFKRILRRRFTCMCSWFTPLAGNHLRTCSWTMRRCLRLNVRRTTTTSATNGWCAYRRRPGGICPRSSTHGVSRCPPPRAPRSPISLRGCRNRRCLSS